MKLPNNPPGDFRVVGEVGYTRKTRQPVWDGGVRGGVVTFTSHHGSHPWTGGDVSYKTFIHAAKNAQRVQRRRYEDAKAFIKTWESEE